MIQKSPEKEYLAKDNNSSESTLDLFHVRTNSYTKLHVNISKNDCEKSGKPNGWTKSGRTDRRTDTHTYRLTDRR